MIEKKVINYYLSFYDVSKDLSEKQFYQFNMAIFKVMFFEEHIDNITFEDKTLNILWKSVKHSIQASVKGYCDKKNIPYDDIFNSLTKPLTKPLTNNAKEKEKGKGNKEYIKEFSFTLPTLTTYDNLSQEYKDKLKEEINKLNLSIAYDDFVDSLIAKGYKYKNFLIAYKNWCKKDFNKDKANSNNTDDDEWSDGVTRCDPNEFR